MTHHGSSGESAGDKTLSCTNRAPGAIRSGETLLIPEEEIRPFKWLHMQRFSRQKTTPTEAIKEKNNDSIH